MSKKRFYISTNGRIPDRPNSDKSLKWLEDSYAVDDAFGRIECPVCHFSKLTILDIQCSNCQTFIAKNRQPIDKDGEMKLAGGLRADELMRRAQRWWDKNGRQYFKRIRNRPGDSIARMPDTAKSGIFMGKVFDKLTRGEKFSVCKAYHHAWYEENYTDKGPDVAAIVL